MIWYSIWAMTVIDVVVIAMVVCALGFLLKQRDRLAWAPAHFGLLIVFAGLSIIALFYFADLLTMHMLPMFMAKSRAMDLMHELHFNARWLVALIGVGAISLGLVIAGRATIVLIDNLEVRERQLSDAQRIGRIGHWRWMLKSGQVVWSDEMYRIFGWDMDSTIPTFDKVLGSIHPEERQKIVDIRASAIAAGRSYEFVCRMVRPDDEVRMVWVEGRLEFDDGGDLVSIFGVLQDVTERKQSEETLDRQSRSIQLMHRVAVAANEASVTDDALQVCLDEVCNYAGWQVGHAYMRDVNSTGELLPTTLWHLDEPERFETFRQVTERTSFAAGVGLPGRVFESGEPAWTMDVTQDANFPQAKLADDIGLRAGFAFPVLVGQEVTAVLEFFSIDAAEPDAHILDVMAQVGTQLGRVIERKRAEDAVRHARSQLQDGIETISEGFVLFDANERLITCNEVYRMYHPIIANILVPGVHIRDIIRTAVERGQHPEAEGRRDEWIKERLAKFRHPTEPLEQYHSNGVWLRVYEKPTRDGGRVGIRTDITALKRREEALRSSEERFRNFAEASSDWFWEMDSDLRFTYHSDRYFEITGFRPEDKIGTTRTRYVDPNNSDADREKWATHLTDLEARRPFKSFEYSFRIPDGSSCHARISGAPVFDTDGNFAGYRGTGTDITERKRANEQIRRAEELLRDAMESIADGFVLFDTDDRVLLWNQNFADMYPELAQMLLTRPTAEEMFRERIRAGAVGDFDVPEDEYVAWRMEQRQKQGGMPAIHRHSDGRWFRTTERRTSVDGIVAISTDVTELKNREAELGEAKELAEQANRAKSEFLATMSHELRTPLNAVIGFSEAIKIETFGPLGSPKYREYAVDINNAGQHLLDLINDILDLSKVESGTDELREQNNEISKVVASVLTLVKERARQGRIELDLEMPDGLPTLRADERKLKQILVNVLSNAIKFTLPGGRVTLKIRYCAESGVTFQIADTGIGIAPENISKALAPFQQVDSNLDRKYEGTGLGLPLTKSLIELHGGSLDLQSTVGVGTTVTLRFPAERVVHETALDAGIGSKRSALPTPIDLGSAVESSNLYSDGQNQRPSGVCRSTSSPRR